MLRKPVLFGSMFAVSFVATLLFIVGARAQTYGPNSGSASTSTSPTSTAMPASTSTSASPNMGTASTAVSVMDYAFSPKTITVSAGTKVTWTNNGKVAHTVTSDDGLFDSGTINPGGTYSHTFDTPGTFNYHCTFHVSMGMVGTVIVTASTAAPNASPRLPNTGGGGAALHR